MPQNDRDFAAEEADLDRQINELNTRLQQLEELGVPYRARSDIRSRRDDLITQLQAIPEQRQRYFLESELENIRGGSAALHERAEETLTLGRRGIREGERLRLGQAESGLSALNLSESGLGERVRRAERETTAFAESDLESRVRIAEMDETFRAEQQAIERLYASGENELAFHRQVRLLGIQAQYARELAEIESGGKWWNALGSALGTIGGAALMLANPFAGGAVAATSGGDYLDKVL